MGKVIAAIALIAILLGAAVAYEKFSQVKKPGPVAKFMPPVEGVAMMTVEQTPLVLVSEVASIRNKDQRKQAGTMYAGVWSPPEGWQGAVKELTQESGGLAIRIFNPTGASTLASGYWLIAITPEPPEGLKAGDVVRFQGQIDRIDEIMNGLVPEFRIVLRNCRVLSVEKH
jgi:hypothetical protein